LVGWSLGGGVSMQFLIDNPQRVQSLTIIDPISPLVLVELKIIREHLVGMIMLALAVEL